MAKDQAKNFESKLSKRKVGKRSKVPQGADGAFPSDLNAILDLQAKEKKRKK